MAGKRHHIIPRFLMKGFASRIDGDEIFTYVYRKQKPVFEANTKNINVEKHFYGKDGEENFADDVITNLEKDKFSPLIDKLRNQEGKVDHLSSEIADFISNMIIRTKNFRNSFYDLTDNVSQRFDNYLTDNKNIEKILLNQPTFLKNEFEKFWQENLNPIIEENIELLKSNGYNSSKIDAEKKKVFQKFIKEFPAMLKKDSPEFARKLTEIFSELRTNLPKMIQDIHNKHLKQKPVSENRINEYLRLNWYVTKVNAPLILGDVGCVFEVISKRRFKIFDDTYENLVNAFLPISTNKLLVGSRFTMLQNIDVKLLNKVAAHCSFELFISAENSPDKSRLSNSIGIQASLLTNKEIDFYINQMFQNFESLDSLVKTNQ